MTALEIANPMEVADEDDEYDDELMKQAFDDLRPSLIPILQEETERYPNIDENGLMSVPEPPDSETLEQ
jgi:hypothetical protein